ncbi:MAG TPA: CsgG/HfaB family protein [Puia sp.]|nr:CsgG/HfaB family protein [Puia sp.]
MRKSILLALVFLNCLLFPVILKAQGTDEKAPLAILPFVLSKGALMGNSADVVTIQEIVVKEFADKSRFTVLDRSKFDKIVDELKIQSMQEFLNSKIVDQGKQMGAKYLVAGVVNEYKVARSEKDMPDNVLNPFGKKHKVMTYPCSLKMSFGVIEVESGKLLFNNPINVVSNDIFSGDSLTSSNKALSNMQAAVKVQIRNILSGSLKILKIEKTDKNGLPATVLTNGGGNIIIGKEKVRMGVYVTESISGYTREKQIAELKSSNVDNEIVVCDVKSGAKELDDAIKANTPLIVKIIKK